MTSEISKRGWRQVLSSAALAVAGGTVVASLLFVSDGAISAEDKYKVQVRGGLAFSEFRGFEDWATVAVSQSGDLIEVILANPVMIKAYRAGVPRERQAFPRRLKDGEDSLERQKGRGGAQSDDRAGHPARLSWCGTASDFRRAATGDTPSSTMTARPTRSSPREPAATADSPATIVAKKDYVFTVYGKR